MKDVYKGKVYVLGDDIDTDAIIPAQYLNLSHTNPDQKDEIASFALSGLPEESIPFVEKGSCRTLYNIIVAGKNFGCGSSRAQAPGCLNAAGVEVIIAEYYARIFFRNSVNAGLLLPLESVKSISDKVETNDELEIHISKGKVINNTKSEEYRIKPVGAIEDILKEGNIFNYARKRIAKLNEQK